MNITNDVFLLVLTPIVVVFLVIVYALQSAANKILRIDSGVAAKRIDFDAGNIFNGLRGRLEGAGLVLNIIQTDKKGQAYRVAYQVSQQDCDGIVCVGGDGTVHEVINGLLSRSDATIARLIPCGSNNELARTLGIFSPEQAAAMLIRGQSRPLDILAITSLPPDNWLSPERTLYSFQGVGWGLTSEMVSVAERLRWWVSPTPLSPLRLTLAAILTILTTLTLPRYSAKLSFLPLPSQASTISHDTHSETSQDNPNSPLTIATHTHTQGSRTGACAVNTNQCVGCERPMKFNKGKRPSTDLKDWVIVDGKTDKLLFFTASNTPGKLAPNAHLSDGYMDVSLITACSRLRLTRLLMKDERLSIATENNDLIAAHASSIPIPSTPSAEMAGSHHGYHVRQYKTSQIRLELDRALPLVVDGELLEVPDGLQPLVLNIDVRRSLCHIIC